MLSCPPRHLSHHHSITVCLHYLRSWMNHGSGLSLWSSGGSALPCLPSPPPSLSVYAASPNNPTPAHTHANKHTQESWSCRLLSPTHINLSHGRVCNFSPLLIFSRYWGLLWLDHSTIKAPSAVPKAEVLHMGHVSSCGSVKAWALKKSTYEIGRGAIWRMIHWCTC